MGCQPTRDPIELSPDEDENHGTAVPLAGRRAGGFSAGYWTTTDKRLLISGKRGGASVLASSVTPAG